MPRPLTPSQQTTLGHSVTKPRYLIWFEYDTPSTYSTGPDTTVTTSHPWLGGSQTFYASFVTVTSLTTNKVGQQRASIQFENITTGASELALLGSARDRRALIFLYYPPLGGGSVVGPEVVFEGYMDGAVMNDTSLTVNLISRSSFYGSVPRLVLGPPYVNHAPLPGTKYSWGDTSDATLDKRR
jgi:hypothetical protein